MKRISALAQLLPESWDKIVDVPVSSDTAITVRMVLPGAAADKVIAEGVEAFRAKTKKRLLAEMDSGATPAMPERIVLDYLEGLEGLTDEELAYRVDEFDRDYIEPYPQLAEKKAEHAALKELATKMCYVAFLLEIERQETRQNIPDFLLEGKVEAMTDEEKDAARRKVVEKEMAKRKNILLALPIEKLQRRVREFAANLEATAKANDFAILLRVWSACRSAELDKREERVFAIEEVTVLTEAVALGAKLYEKMLEKVQDNAEVLASFVAKYMEFAEAPTTREINDAAKGPFRNGDATGTEEVANTRVEGGLAAFSRPSSTVN